MKSKFNSRCPRCDGFVNKGDEISNRDGKWGHSICPRKAEPVLGNPTYNVQRGMEPVDPDTFTFDFPHTDLPSEPIATAASKNPESRPGFQLSAYQSAAIKALETTSSNIVVIAVAGSGKSTLEQIMLYHVPTNARCIYLAFNKAIQTEFKSKAPESVDVLTTHSLGLRLLTKMVGRVTVDEMKSFKIMDELFPMPPQAFGPELAAERFRRKQISQVVSLCKATLTDGSNTVAMQAMCDRYGIDLTAGAAAILKAAGEVLAKSEASAKVIDFDDMLYMAVIRGCGEMYDFVFVDEAQDLNACQIQFVKNLLGTKGRIIAVGDPAQSIYGFRGADTDAIPRLIRELHATVLPLSITYRCPKSHVALAQGLVPTIEAAPTATQGTIEYIKAAKFAPVDGDLCLSRVNAALVAPAFALIRAGRKAIIKGRDIGAQLVSLADKLATGCGMLAEMYTKLESYQATERVRLDARRAPDSAYQALEDRVMTLDAVMAECQTPQEVGRRISAVFTDDNTNGVTFSSVHRAKGLEANTVYILAPEKLPMTRKNQQDWEKIQEKNIVYVAYTRSKDKLIFVESEPTKN